MTEHITKEKTAQDVSGLLIKARERKRDESDNLVPTEEAIANYSQALALIQELAKTASPKDMFELHDQLERFPNRDFGEEGEAVLRTLKDSLIKGYRDSIFSFKGWGH